MFTAITNNRIRLYINLFWPSLYFVYRVRKSKHVSNDCKKQNNSVCLSQIIRIAIIHWSYHIYIEGKFVKEIVIIKKKISTKFAHLSGNSCVTKCMRGNNLPILCKSVVLNFCVLCIVMRDHARDCPALIAYEALALFVIPACTTSWIFSAWHCA